MPQSFKSFSLVFIQFSSLVFLGVYAGLWSSFITVTVGVVGVLIGLWAIITMKCKVNIFPDVLEKQKLYMSGPYRFIRHPMYLSVLLVAVAWVIERADIYTVLIFVMLCGDLLIKLHYEEQLLIQSFDGYDEYRNGSKKIIPFLY